MKGAGGAWRCWRGGLERWAGGAVVWPHGGLAREGVVPQGMLEWGGWWRSCWWRWGWGWWLAGVKVIEREKVESERERERQTRVIVKSENS